MKFQVVTRVHPHPMKSSMTILMSLLTMMDVTLYTQVMVMKGIILRLILENLVLKNLGLLSEGSGNTKQLTLHILRRVKEAVPQKL